MYMCARPQKNGRPPFRNGALAETAKRKARNMTERA